MNIIRAFYQFLWSDLITIPLPGGGSIGFSLLVLILIPSGIYFTIKTRFLLFRHFPKMLKIVTEKKNGARKNSISGVQALIISTATRVGMGNLVGVVAAISVGGAGAVFWMWVTALLGSPLRRLPGRPCILYPSPVYQERQPTQALRYRRTICHLRPDLLVRHQPGDRKLRLLSL